MTTINNNEIDAAILKIRADAQCSRRIVDLPKPDEKFLNLAARFRYLSEKERSPAIRFRLQKELKTRFASAFGFTKDFGQQTVKFCRFLFNHYLEPETGFDHLDFFQSWEKLVIISQPYELDEAELERWANRLGASYTIANDWSYHYPGKTSLFFAEFDPRTRMHYEQYGPHFVTLRHVISRLDELEKTE